MPDPTELVVQRLLTDGCPPFALLRRRTPGRDHDTVEVLIGRVREVDRLADLPVGPQPSLALVPFRQIAERGFDVRDDGTPLSVLVADERYELPLASVLEVLRSLDV
ncbi:phenazine-specific anthranilate synthase component I, partial [Streptomyces sp. NPDC059744]